MEDSQSYWQGSQLNSNANPLAKQRLEVFIHAPYKSRGFLSIAMYQSINKQRKT